MKLAKPCVLAINGGSSSIKLSLFESNRSLTPILDGQIDGIGRPESKFRMKGTDPDDNFSRRVSARSHSAAVCLLMDWIQERIECGALTAIGHRVVHGGPKYWEPQRITREMIEALRELSPFDPEHLPEEILLAEALGHRFPNLAQIACFDTAFHHDMPRVARLLPIPRRFEEKGVRRYGFHGLSYSYLIQELGRVGGPAVASGRVILAHLGSGASMAALLDGRSIDTSMGFTPAAGLVMGTRSGDLDPGLVSFLARSEQMSANQFDRMVNHEAGLLGVSGCSSDMRELLARETEDAFAAEAVALFCYQAKKWLGAYAAALGGIDTVVFSGGIGENAPLVRSRICNGLSFIGIELNEKRNAETLDIISTDASQVTVRVIRTNEELMIARSVCNIVGLAA